MSGAAPRRRSKLLILLVAGPLLIAMAIGFAATSRKFGYHVQVIDMPIPAAVAGLVIAGLVYVGVAWAVTSGFRPAASRHRQPGDGWLLAYMVVIGLGLRLAMFASEPMLEDDYQRYLWDGAVTANGLSPYRLAPSDAIANDRSKEVAKLANDAGLVLLRVNHPDLRTIYPPVAQSAFALAYLIEPWSLAAWRLVCLLADIAALALIFRLLNAVAMPAIYATLYWWNPLVIKELFNSAHMEAILTPLLLGALLLAVHKRFVLATGALAFAVGAKLWPGLLLPLLVRPLLARPWRLAGALALFGAACAVWALPIVLAGLDQSSGFVAYAQKWRTNGALFDLLEGSSATLLHVLGLGLDPGTTARLMIGVALGAIGLGVAWSEARSARDLVGRAAIVAGAMVLLSPAQFPWYMAWVLPLIPIWPIWGFMALAVTMPLYYSAFYLLARDQYAIFTDRVIWIIWVPIWALILGQWAWTLTGSRGTPAGRQSPSSSGR